MRSTIGQASEEIEYQVVQSGPLSPAQLWWQYTNTPILNLSFRMKFTLPVNWELFCQAWRYLVQNQPILRTIFPEGERAQVQCEIVPPFDLPIEYADLSLLSDVEFELAVNDWQKRLNASVDLKRWPLVKIALLKQADENYTMLYIQPSYLGDVLSVGWILFKEFSAVYQNLLAGQELKPYAKQDRYQDYNDFLNQLDKSVVDQYRSYWETALADLDYALPQDFAKGRNTFDSERCYSASWELPVEKLKGNPQSSKHASIYQYMLLALHRVCARWSGSSQTVICERISGRDLPIAKNLFHSPGFYVADQVIPLKFGEEETIEAQLQQVSERLDDSSMKGAMYNCLNFALGEQKYPQHKVAPIRIDYMGRMKKQLQKGLEFISFRGRFLLDRWETDINYGFTNIGATIREGILESDRLFLLDLTPLIQQGRLIFPIYYSANLHSMKTIEWFSAEFYQELLNIIDEGAAAGYRCIY